MKHAIPHDLDVATAKMVADRAFAEYKSRYGQYEPTLRWASDRRADIGFTALGKTLHGAIEIAEREISVDLDVPFLLRPFRSKAIEVIEREVQLWIGKARAGQI